MHLHHKTSKYKQRIATNKSRTIMEITDPLYAGSVKREDIQQMIAAVHWRRRTQFNKKTKHISVGSCYSTGHCHNTARSTRMKILGIHHLDHNPERAKGSILSLG